MFVVLCNGGWCCSSGATEGPGSLLAKLDIRSAYRIVPVLLADRPLLGMRWEGALYFDTALPFGLRSAQDIQRSGRLSGMGGKEAGGIRDVPLPG